MRSENDIIGVCFYGTDKKKNINDFENIYVFIELDTPDAQKILDLEALLGEWVREMREAMCVCRRDMCGV